MFCTASKGLPGHDTLEGQGRDVRWHTSATSVMRSLVDEGGGVVVQRLQVRFARVHHVT
jgi:hypothetical protein